MQKSSENKAITIYDIAREAGVSPATVSRVLTNNANVSKAKKEKVQGLIEKYNFKPNALAKGLSDTQSKVIGIIAADVRNAYYADIFVACENAAREMGYTVLLSNALGNMEHEMQHLDMMRQQRVDALIQLGGSVDAVVSYKEYVKKVQQITATIPMVVTGKLDGVDCYEVQIDFDKATDFLMEYLFGLGHERIALVSGRHDVLGTWLKRRRYEELLEKHGIPYREEYVVEGSYDYESGYFGMNQILALEDKPTAVITINDYVAAGVVRSAVEHGYRIPQDISVTSYDNTQLAELLTPRLTSIDYNYVNFGRMLINTAVAASKGITEPRNQKIAPRLIVRESSGPVSGAFLDQAWPASVEDDRAVT